MLRREVFLCAQICRKALHCYSLLLLRPPLRTKTKKINVSPLLDHGVPPTGDSSLRTSAVDKERLSWITTLIPTHGAADIDPAPETRDAAPEPDPAPQLTSERNHLEWVGVLVKEIREMGQMLKEYLSPVATPKAYQHNTHLYPLLRFTSASNTGNSWPPPVTPEIQMGYALLCLDGISVYCAAVSTKTLYFRGSDVSGYRIHTVQYTQSSFSSSWLKAGTLYSCFWSEYSLYDLCDARREVSSPGLTEFMDMGFQFKGGFTIPIPHVLLLLTQKEPEFAT
ncbi:hypothetical protein TURU_086103 [Turdus rufiventris]|nr:hypothetical protein TURU_086103 [Turdus rufiventris]